MRKMSIPVSAWQSDFIKAGDRVDVILAYAKPAPSHKDTEGISTSTNTIPVASMIFQYMKVLRSVPAEKTTGLGAVEVAVNPLEAEYLAWGLAWGKGISLAVRGPGDIETHPTEDISMQKLLR